MVARARRKIRFFCIRCTLMYEDTQGCSTSRIFCFFVMSRNILIYNAYITHRNSTLLMGNTAFGRSLPPMYNSSSMSLCVLINHILHSSILQTSKITKLPSMHHLPILIQSGVESITDTPLTCSLNALRHLCTNHPSFPPNPLPLICTPLLLFSPFSPPFPLFPPPPHSHAISNPNPFIQLRYFSTVL